MAAYRILVYDDDPTAALITQRGLQTLLGDEVIVQATTNANEAWLACANGNVDLLIVDPSPYGAAAALIRAVRTYRPYLPILALTAYDTPGLRARMQALGVELYAAKPIELRELAPLVVQALHHSANGVVNN
ncbi:MULTISPECIES: response regulator [Chloroflexus]|jgi:CheY-like chemotaxis protein|uniref:Response regulator receiver protein n=1 Tax=Chloroflexus aggregans (strain MD-66 / DSM 9485) TaxID=326427 RepID=B8GD31_CHLAD|nr:MULTISPECIES: response regulator [Chloroflexus]ACL25098.1 response regulator receiver protein [Chloroflexus aggregans DSM 9485]GIV88633.1 MAG: response regulator [Chloroflexus sp.]